MDFSPGSRTVSAMANQADSPSRLALRRPIEQLDQPGVRPDLLQLLSAGLLVFGPLGAFAYALSRLWGSGITWLDVGLMVGMYLVTGYGVTIGFHRHLCHGAFRAKRPLRLVLLVAGSMAIQGAVVTWVAQHRKHHAFSERDGDPHSPHRYGDGLWQRLKGLVYAHVGWFFGPNWADARRWAPDLLADDDVMLISKTALLWTALSFALPFGIAWAVTGTVGGGLLGLLWGGAVRLFLLHQVTFATNSICHVLGSRPFRTGDRSGNVAPLALISMGESWHNAHHAFPALARHGVDSWQLDTSAELIRLFEKAGWVSHVRWPRPERLDTRRRGNGAAQQAVLETEDSPDTPEHVLA